MIRQSEISIFTDGAARVNPGPGGFAAIIIFPDGEINNRGGLNAPGYTLRELGGREAHTTNNRMELTAAIEALRELQSPIANRQFPIFIYSDSSYLVNGITKWVWRWQQSGWRTKTKTPVENRDLWQELATLTRRCEALMAKKIEWRLIGGHSGVAGNERCDELATAFADNRALSLYSGPLEKYPVKNILDFSYDTLSRRKKSQATKRRPAEVYSYVSLVDGVVRVHKSWPECEGRVMGKSGARFKKVFSEEEEQQLVEKWCN